MLVDAEGQAGAFGIVGGFVQAQAHVQFVSGLVDDELDPQAALDRPRFRVDGDQVLLEEGLWDRAEEVEALGLEAIPSLDTRSVFGCGQAVLRTSTGVIGASDGRGDGQAGGF